MQHPALVRIRWTRLRQKDALWQDSLCLYSYTHPRDNLLLYLGKADFHSIRQRMNAPDKDALFAYFEQVFGLKEVVVFQGELILDQGQRRSSALLADVESLLILRLKPMGNIMCTQARGISRPGLRIVCAGHWPHPRSTFHDRG